MTDASLQTAIYPTFSGLLGITTIWATPRTATGVTPRRPTPPYATLQILAKAQDGGPADEGMAEDVGGDAWHVPVTDDLTVTLSVQAYGVGASDAIRALRLGLARSSVTATLKAAGVGVLTQRSINVQAALQGIEWEPRAGLEVDIYTQDQTLVDEGYIDEVSLALTMVEPDDTEIETTITYPEA